MDTPQQAAAVLLCAMATVGVIFILFGEACLLAYGSIDEGSIAAFVADREGAANARVAAQNLLICAAVALTYPIQFFPAIQVHRYILNCVARSSLSIHSCFSFAPSVVDTVSNSTVKTWTLM
jgi:Transmembrane amino acid transporter protein